MSTKRLRVLLDRNSSFTHHVTYTQLPIYKWQIDLTGLLLQTIYQIGSLLKVFTQGIPFFMHSAMHVGDTGEPPLALVR